MVMDRLSSPLVWMPLLSIVISIIYYRITAKAPLPKSLPWIGEDSSKMFAGTRARLMSFNNVRQLLNEGYNKVRDNATDGLPLLTSHPQFSRNGKAYVFPDFSGNPEVLVPSTQMRWLLDQVCLHLKKCRYLD